MPRLLLLRHAKSAWGEPSLKDHDRPLNARGRAACATMAGWLAERNLRPDLVLSSTSTRTRETWARLAEAAGWKHEPVWLESLYLATADTMLTALRREGRQAHTVMMIGHSPGIEGLARRLGAAGDTAARRRMLLKFPTAGLAWIELEGTWTDAGSSPGRLEAFVTPRELDASTAS
ncbi:MAG: histidine phosphatase family protein [Pseudomonadota bacterium]|nr:histidine phosphatase family protein [Pseudomonadota bacterium]